MTAPIESSIRPVLLWDGECWFCSLCIERLEAWTTDSHGARIEITPYQKSLVRFPDVPVLEAESSVQLMVPAPGPEGGRLRYQKSRAIFEAMGRAGRRHPGIAGIGRALCWMSAHVPLFSTLMDRGYEFVADHRRRASWLSGFLFGESFAPSTYRLSDFLFRKGLFLVFLIGFLSLLPQWKAIFGMGGIAPLADWVGQLEQAGMTNGSKLTDYFSWFWWTGAGDGALALVLYSGIAAATAGLLVPRQAPPWIERTLLGFSILGYLSWVSLGQSFFQFQWDALLLECGWLALILPVAGSRGDGRFRALVLQLLLFKLVFLSGWVKAFGGDAAWDSRTALLYHFETQPLPTPVGAWMHGVSEPLLKLFCTLVLGVELWVPFLIFFPRRIRFVGFCILTGLQLAFAVTGNFGFFNLLSLLLGLFLVDDRTWRELLPKVASKRLLPWTPVRTLPEFGWARASAVVAAALLGGGVFLPVGVRTGWIQADTMRGVAERAGALHVSNSYGLFSHMTTERRELVFEASVDGKEWKEYQPRYRPGEVSRAPSWVAPYQPRFDWQLWFAVMGNYGEQSNRWVGLTLKRILEGNREVLDLFRENPFSGANPQHARVSVYRYQLLPAGERTTTGVWWRREWLGHYSPQISIPRPVSTAAQGTTDPAPSSR